MTDRPKFHMTNAVHLCVYRFKTTELTSLLILKYYNHTKCFKYFACITFRPANLCCSDHEQHHQHLYSHQMPRFCQNIVLTHAFPFPFPLRNFTFYCSLENVVM